MILSVSRRTDIPAFYSDWFFNRLKEGDQHVGQCGEWTAEAENLQIDRPVIKRRRCMPDKDGDQLMAEQDIANGAQKGKDDGEHG